MLGLSGESETVDSSYQSDMGYILEHMCAVMTLPGTGEASLSDTSCIDNMLEALPNLKWVGVVVSWFINSTNISTATIKPGIEKTADECKDAWRVGEYNRTNAYEIHRSKPTDSATVRYGGTTPDADVLSFVSALQEKGVKVAFYPFLMVDNAGKDWRGQVTGSAENVSNFYLNQYKPFVEHYALLLQNEVDIFYLGSELEGLTSLKGAGENFPFVGCLVDLASNVNAILKDTALISYAANWSEYHSCKGGYRPLDDLWINKCINFVGIDYYMPLTDSKEDLTKDQIKAGFTSGEGIEYYLDGDKPVEFNNKNDRWKDLKHWHSSRHEAWDPEARESYKTAWVPESKPIIFSEFGFRSIKLATNTPSAYGDVVPKHSSGKVDFPVQMRAIRATLEHIKENEGVAMGFCYGWDTRNPTWCKRFADGDQWEKGHWISGKIKRR